MVRGVGHVAAVQGEGDGVVVDGVVGRALERGLQAFAGAAQPGEVHDDQFAGVLAAQVGEERRVGRGGFFHALGRFFPKLFGGS